MTRWFTAAFVLACWGVQSASGALVTNITDFAVFGHDGTTFAVDFGGSLSAANSIIGSNENIRFGNSAVVGSVQAVGNIQAGGTFSGTNVYANGNVTFGNNPSVSGTVSHGGTLGWGGTPSFGSVLSGGSALVVPTIAMPAATVFTAGGSNITSSTAINPGSYGSVVVGGSQTLTLNGPGEYRFTLIDAGGNFTLNLNGAGPYTILVAGQIDTEGTFKILGTGAVASDVYIEVGSFFTTGNMATVVGTVYAPSGNITFGGTASLSGAVWAGGFVDFGNSASINYVASNNLPSQFQAAVVPEPASLAIWGAFGLSMAVGAFRNRSQGRHRSRS